MISPNKILFFLLKLFQHIPAAPKVHDAQSSVIEAVAGAAFLSPDMAAVVGTDIPFIAAVVVGFHDLQYSHVAVAVSMGGFREVAVVKMFHIADMGKGDSGAVSADDISHMVLLICPQRAGAEAEAVVFVIHHGEEAADGFLVHQKSWKAENVPWGIVLLAGGDAAGGAGLLLLFGIIAVVRNIVEPKVVGAQIGLHPIATITAMYAGLQIAGVAGMFAAPVFILLARRLREERRTSA